MLSLLALTLSAAPGPLLPRAAFFGHPAFAGPQLSPDGTRLAFLKPDGTGVPQLWVGGPGPTDAKPLTRCPGRGVRQYWWAFDNTHIVYLHDPDGRDENHLFQLNTATGTLHDLTPGTAIRTVQVEVAVEVPGQVAVVGRFGTPPTFAVGRFDLKTRAFTADEGIPASQRLGWDGQLRPRLVVGALADGRQTLQTRPDADGPWRELRRWGPNEELLRPTLTADGTTVHAATSLGTNTARIAAIDAATGREKVLLADPQFDAGPVLLDARTRTPLAAAAMRDGPDWVPLDPRVEADLETLARLHPGDMQIIGQTAAGTQWIVEYRDAARAPVWYRYDRTTRAAKKLGTLHPSLMGLSETAVWDIAARDGLTLRSYYTRPPGRHAVPLVVLVHDGPDLRDQRVFHPTALWLADRGYGVLRNDFRNAGNREWTRKLLSDLGDGIHHAVQHGQIDRTKVAVMGVGFGGYLALAAATFTPNDYCCAVSIAGPSDLELYRNRMPPNFAPAALAFQYRTGVLTPEGADLPGHSPVGRVDTLRGPVLLARFGLDPRVVEQDTVQFLDAARSAGKSATAWVYADERDKFDGAENRVHFYAQVEKFFAQHLGGRCEPAEGLPGHRGVEK
jgi:dipeptidyl aminopeptidase/acylaminoacyl peptidase